VSRTRIHCHAVRPAADLLRERRRPIDRSRSENILDASPRGGSRSGRDRPCRTHDRPSRSSSFARYRPVGCIRRGNETLTSGRTIEDSSGRENRIVQMTPGSVPPRPYVVRWIGSNSAAGGWPRGSPEASRHARTDRFGREPLTSCRSSGRRIVVRMHQSISCMHRYVKSERSYSLTCRAGYPLASSRRRASSSWPVSAGSR
jgi:hypothetical protein